MTDSELRVLDDDAEQRLIAYLEGRGRAEDEGYGGEMKVVAPNTTTSKRNIGIEGSENDTETRQNTFQSA